MGDVIKKVNLCGMLRGRKQGCLTVKALLDTGATISVIDVNTAAALRGDLVPSAKSLDGRLYPTMVASIQLAKRGCIKVTNQLVVSDQLARKAGEGASMILGSDYMQASRVNISMRARKDGASCFKSRKRR